jgi:hypothetical protein
MHTRAAPAAVGGAGSQPKQADASTSGSFARNLTGEPGTAVSTSVTIGTGGAAAAIVRSESEEEPEAKVIDLVLPLQRKQQTQQLECNARAAVRRKRVAACMLREYCPWGQTVAP